MTIHSCTYLLNNLIYNIFAIGSIWIDLSGHIKWFIKQADFGWSEIKWHARNNLLQHLLMLDDGDIHAFSYHEQWWHSQWSYWVQESIEFVAGWHLYSLKWTWSLQGGPFGQSPIVGPRISVSLWAWESKVKQLCESQLCESDQRLTLFTPQLLLPSFHSQALY